MRSPTTAACTERRSSDEPESSTAAADSGRRSSAPGHERKSRAQREVAVCICVQPEQRCYKYYGSTHSGISSRLRGPKLDSQNWVTDEWPQWPGHCGPREMRALACGAVGRNPGRFFLAFLWTSPATAVGWRFHRIWPAAKRERDAHSAESAPQQPMRAAAGWVHGPRRTVDKLAARSGIDKVSQIMPTGYSCKQ